MLRDSMAHGAISRRTWLWGNFLCYLADHDNHHRSGKPKLAITYLTLAANHGHAQPALLMAERFGDDKYLTPERKPID